MTEVDLDWGITHPGAVRPYNEDALVRRPEAGLWAVADGAGGHRTGDVASGMIATALGGIPPGLDAADCLSQVRLRLAAVHQALRDRAARGGLDEADGAGAIIASTVAVLLVRAGHFVCLWAGDSRVYLLRDGALQPITRDHSLVQALVDAGDLSETEAEHHPQANVITRAVGSHEDVLDLDKVTGSLLDGDRFLLCSDGLCKTLDLPTLAALTGSAPDPAQALIEAALAAGARDNVTAVVVEPGTAQPAAGEAGHGG